MAAAKGRTPAQLALAWLLTRDNVIPIPGTSSFDRLTENVGALDITLTRDDLGEIERLSPKGAAAGLRYNTVMGGLIDRQA
jgi:aryl-alcohol dehydrogenase-like predicted oxidoreductase